MKIAVIGETCTDKFIYCKCDRLSPEAPVPILIPVETTTNSGMSGNVVNNIISLVPDCKVTHIHQLNKITKTRFVEKKSNHIFFRLDEGDDNCDKYLKKYELNDFDIVIVSDYDKGFLSDKDLIEISSSSKLSILDSKKSLSKEVIDSFDFIKLNELESKRNSYSENIITTLGPKGAKFRNKIYPSPNPKDTIDVSGAGDTFTSSFIIKYLETGSIDESIIFANQMSSIVVSKRGVAVPN
jgi:D-beta-D-heptose 7-phosphate kinase/D-beta-D-heptose 1-phosphate adenosyltransferase